MPDWYFFTCPSCCLAHCDTLFASPPSQLLNCFVAKARADGAAALVQLSFPCWASRETTIAVLTIFAQYWNKLLRASVLSNPEEYLRVHRQQASLGSDVDGELAIFAVDFAPHASLRRSSSCAPPCGAETLFRGRPTLGSLVDQAERSRIHAELAAVRLALQGRRPSPHPPSHVAHWPPDL